MVDCGFMIKAQINDTTYEISRHPETNAWLLNGREVPFEVLASGEGVIRFKVGEREIDVVRQSGTRKQPVVELAGQTFEVTLEDPHDQLLERLGMSRGSDTKQSELKAPMPGLVLDILVGPGQAVSKGDPLLILEAMKMENVIKASADVTIQTIACEKGAAVEKNEVLIEFA